MPLQELFRRAGLVDKAKAMLALSPCDRNPVPWLCLLVALEP